MKLHTLTAYELAKLLTSMDTKTLRIVSKVILENYTDY